MPTRYLRLRPARVKPIRSRLVALFGPCRRSADRSVSNAKRFRFYRIVSAVLPASAAPPPKPPLWPNEMGLARRRFADRWLQIAVGSARGPRLGV